MQAKAIDLFLARCARVALGAREIPEWPGDWEEPDASFLQRASFHGVALLLSEAFRGPKPWPRELNERIREEAGVQRFWETSHRKILEPLLMAFADADITALITKGTALAYSHYPNAAARQRGDTDILFPTGNRKAVRKVLASCGFRQVGDRRPYQEDWLLEDAMGLPHMIDVHWRINASGFLSQALERGGFGSECEPLPGLCEQANTVGPAQNLILTCLNRSLHQEHGYWSDSEKHFEGDRLIWAVDIALITRAFGSDGWERLLTIARSSGTAPIVLSGLMFAHRTLETAIPEDVIRRLETDAGDKRVLDYMSGMSSKSRTLLDLSSSAKWVDKGRVLASALFPTSDFIRERYPNKTGWPINALRLHRLFDRTIKSVRGQS